MTKVERTRRRLLGFAVELFARQGYHATTIPEIVAAAGVSRATFFLHFPTKAALLGEMSRELAELWDSAPALLEEAPDAAILRFVTFLFDQASADAIGSAILVDFSLTYGADMAVGIGRGTLHDRATALIATAQESGYWTRDWAPEALAHHLLASFNLLRGELADMAPDEAAGRLLKLLIWGTARA